MVMHPETRKLQQKKPSELTFASDPKSSPTASMSTLPKNTDLSPSHSNSSSLRSSTRANISLSKHSNPSLHDNLMRRRKHRNPHELFEVVDVLGVGSMGSVSKVKKKEDAIGGSARSSFVNKFNADQFAFCFSLPVVGSLLESCSGKRRENKKNGLLMDKSDTSQSSIGSSNSRKKYFRKTSSIITYGESEEIYYALKSIHMEHVRNEVYRQELKNEIELLKTLDHPNIVKAIETFEYHNHVYILLELCSGGDLYVRDPYTEEQAATIISSICSAVAYMHSVGITHRDLKYENVVFANSTPDSEVKIIDFGLSRTYGKDDRLHDTCGTIYTMAPEVLRGDYTNEADIWSIGVLAFMLLSSSMPFYGKRRKNVMDRILNGEYSFKGRRWKRISHGAKSFVTDLLKIDPLERPTAAEASQHMWLSREFTDDGDAAEVAMMDAVQATLQNFASYGTLKKLGLMVIAHKSTSQEIGYLRKIFGKYDQDNSGIITMSEFKSSLMPYGYTDEEMEIMFQGIDLDGTGVVHYTEFLAASIEAHGKINEEQIAEAFDRLDNDDSGYITAQNLRDFLGESMPASYLDEIIDEADLVEDHRISYDEFLQLWNSDDDSQRQDSFHDVVTRRMRHSPSSQMSAGQNSSSHSNTKSSSTSGTVMYDVSENTSDPDLSTDEDYWTGQVTYQSERAKSMRMYDM